LACAPNLAGAIYKGILETVERDAFMITWLNRIEPPSLDIWSIDDPFVQHLLNAIKDLPVRVHAKVLTLDIQIPIILIIVSSESGSPYTIVGLGIDLNPIRAVTLALEEACLTTLGMARYAQYNPENFRPAPDYLNVKNLDMHGLAHAISPDLRQSVEFLTKSNTLLSVKDLPNVSSESMVKNVKTLVDMIHHKNLDVIFVDLTTSDIDEVGFKVARVVVPGLQPLDIDHEWRHLGGERLYQVPVQLGLLNKPLSEESLNPFPHPFP
jgi:ribosomal protein S12 methylthiotransferase accessory factor